jgi:hypothetical protein
VLKQLQQGYDVNMELTQQCKELKKENKLLSQMLTVKADTEKAVSEAQRQLSIRLQIVAGN